MIIERFEDIKVWQKSRVFVGKIYDIFVIGKDYSFKDQVCRASVSIMNNIAEGFEKRSDRDFVKYLNISKGSCAEVRSMLYLAKDLGYIGNEDFLGLYKESVEISKMLAGFIKVLRK